MSISEAIARVRRGATRSRSGLLDGALSYLGVRLKTDLASRLKSDSVPQPLRPLATRLASLIKLTDPPPYDDSARQQLEVVSMDRALARAAQQERTSQAASKAAAVVQAAHPAGDVCPFTGLRADGSLAEQPAAAPPVAHPAAAAPPAAHPAAAHPAAAAPPAAHPAAAHPAIPPPAIPPPAIPPPAIPPPANVTAPASAVANEELAVATRLPIPTAANDASSVVSTAIAAGGDVTPAPAAAGSAKPKKPAAKRAPGEATSKAGSEKRKEKLAAPQDVTNTSARSATRPANKQSSGKGQTSSRKKA
jgi:hypothetical protein